MWRGKQLHPKIVIADEVQCFCGHRANNLRETSDWTVRLGQNPHRLTETAEPTHNFEISYQAQTFNDQLGYTQGHIEINLLYKIVRQTHVFET
ncbi:hypothetical protein DPMN_103420 [Dreissena polymorpha]|uniref:Uncharacterized protein n=1 Tax=Dreissena polymorpha TaxID=45954 RepID=A0A9D4K059_DREPO|nr:hypothetical protein DPMN_103420 [Dreissena polymorpha]